jgi:hypothetical protein
MQCELERILHEVVTTYFRALLNQLLEIEENCIKSQCCTG